MLVSRKGAVKAHYPNSAVKQEPGRTRVKDVEEEAARRLVQQQPAPRLVRLSWGSSGTLVGMTTRTWLPEPRSRPHTHTHTHTHTHLVAGS